MTTIVVLLLIGAIAAAVWWYVRSRQPGAATRPRTGSSNAQPKVDPLADTHSNEDMLYGLDVGDVITYHASDYLVRGRIRFDDSGYTWSEVLMSDEQNQHWLCVEDDEGISLTVWQSGELGDVDGEPGAKRVSYAGAEFKLDESGQAHFTSEGTTGAAPSGQMEYADYRSADGRLLSLERYGSSWEVSVGQSALPGSFNIYPRTR